MKINILHREDLRSPHLEAPDKDSIHIWLLPADALEDIKKDTEALSPQELSRAEKFAHESDRSLYLLGHTALRRILGMYLDLPARSLCFAVGEHGKPVLSPGIPGLPVHFNLSHSGTWLALAFSCAPVGVDIEKLRSSDRILKLVKRYFHPEELPLFSALEADAREQLFYRYWTIREAFLKGLGTGLTLPSQSFFVQPEDNGSCRITKSEADYSHWKIDSVSAPEGYVCSVAYLRS